MKAISTPNIALIKYWGNRNDKLRIPAADSLSMTLDTPHVEVEMSPSDIFSVQSFNADSTEKKLSADVVSRFENHLELMNVYLESIGIAPPLESITLMIRSQIPESIGFASSAAIFSAVARAYSGMLNEKPSEKDVSILSRLGSGSASRSTFGGFAAMVVQGDAIQDAFAEQIADERHWNLHDIVIAPTKNQKKVGSTVGHFLAHTSPLFNARMAALPKRQAECTAAIMKKDFEKLQHVSEVDALDMHKIMQTSTPRLDYLSGETHRIMDEITAIRIAQHLEVLFTMDAGPTVHLICTDDAFNAVLAFATAQKDCTIFESKIGPGSKII